jgi:hypothetical protein
MIKTLGLEICADTIIGNAMVRGVSGGQNKRVTTGARPYPALCLNMRSELESREHLSLRPTDCPSLSFVCLLGPPGSMHAWHMRRCQVAWSTLQHARLGHAALSAWWSTMHACDCAGEMIVGPKRVLFMDEISTGLDSSTTFEIVRYLRDATHALRYTTAVALLQPAPEVYDLFDDVLLLAEGAALSI